MSEGNELIEWSRGIKERLAYEIANGGSEAPCPFCGLPRCQRSDYIRCCRCGINWSPGDELDRDPRMSGLPRATGGLGTAAKVSGVRNPDRPEVEKSEEVPFCTEKSHGNNDEK